MSFGLNKPSDQPAAHTVRANVARRAAAAPAFKPEFARSLRMHPSLAALVAGLVLTLLLAYALLASPTYEAESLIYVEPAAIKALAADPGIFDATKYDTYIQQQILTAGRLDILVAALQTLPRATWAAYGPNLQAAANRLQGEVKIQRAGSSYQLSFTLRGTDPVKTADTLNAIVKTYLAAGRKDELAQSDVRTQILLEERQRIQNELTADKAEQAQLSSLLGMANPGLDAGNAYDEQLTGLRTQLAAARENHEIAAAQLAAVSGQEAAHLSGLTAAADEQVNADPALSSMKSSIVQRRATLAGQIAGLTPENPISKQDQEELNDLDRQLAGATQTARDLASRRLQAKLRTDLSRTGDIESRLNAQLAQQTAAATSASPKLQRAAELNADLKRLTTRFASVDDSLRSLQLDASGPGLAHLALAATPPPFPLASRVRLLRFAALPVALLCGLFAAVFARKRDHHIYTGPDLEYVLGFTPIAILPAVADVSAGVLREYILRLAAGVEGAYRGGNARTFVLTAAGAGTDLAALTRALEDRLASLGLDAASVTAGQILDPAFIPAAGETAASDTAGTALQPHRDPHARSEGFAAARLDLLKGAHDLVLIQAPAILTSAETEYVVRLADATILVAESGVTTRGDLLQAALLLERLNARGIGAVLENLELRNADPAYLKAIRLLERRQSAEMQPRTTPLAPDSAAPAPAEPVPAAPGTHVAAAPPAVEPVASPIADSLPVSHVAMLKPDASPAGEQPLPAVASNPSANLAPHIQTQADAPPEPPPATLVSAPQQKAAIVPEIIELPLPEAASSTPVESIMMVPEAQAEPVVLVPERAPSPHPEPATLVADLPDLPEPPALTAPLPDERVTEAAAPVFAAAAEPVIPQAAPPTDARLEPLPDLEPLPAELLFAPQAAPAVASLEPALSLASVVPSPSLQNSIRDVAPPPAAAPSLEPVRSEPLQPKAAPSFRTARMEVEPARRNSGPWRDRRVPGSDAHIQPSQDRRFNWIARAAEIAARNAPPPPEAAPAAAPMPAAEPIPISRPHLVAREAGLTRSWGLLSRYQAHPPETQEMAPEDAREYRRG